MRPPLDVAIRVTPHGAFGFQRKKPADGRCGYKNKYPCTHKGVDMAASKGTPVYAPEAGVVVISVSDNVTPPLRGYGPGAVVLRGDSGVNHLLAHLDPDWWHSAAWQIPPTIFDGFIGPDRAPSEGRRYREAEQIGIVAKDHVHWEISRGGNRYDPLVWLKTGGRSVRGGAAAGGGHGGLLLILLLAAASRRT